MKRKIAAIMVMALLGCSVTACGLIDGEPDIDEGMHIAADDAQQRLDGMEENDSSGDVMKESSYLDGEKNKDIPDDFAWDGQTVKWTDKNGYSMEMDVKFSPWFQSSDQELAYAAWEEVGQGYTLPLTNDEWKLKRSTAAGKAAYYIPYRDRSDWGGDFAIEGEISEIYYSVGQIVIRNNTDGWSFSDEHLGAVTICISPIGKGGGSSNDFNRNHFIARIFTREKIRTFGAFAKHTVDMNSDASECITVIIAHADCSSPKYPDGEYLNEITEGELQVTVWEGTVASREEIPILKFSLPLYIRK